MNVTNTNCRFAVTDFVELKKKMLTWANRFGIFCFLDNHEYQTEHHSVECMLAVGTTFFIKDEAGNALDKFQEFLNTKTG